MLTRSHVDKPKSPLDGRLIAIKDNICTAELPTTCASGILKDYTSPFDATVVRRLKAAGAVVAGKTNLDEFGMGFVDKPVLWSTTRLTMACTAPIRPTPTLVQ